MTRRLGRNTGAVVRAINILLGIVVVAALATLVLTGTDWGRERVRRIAQSSLQRVVRGHVAIGRITGNLLVGMTVHNLTITDSSGTPFVSVQSFSGDYDLGALWQKKIWIKNALVVQPLVYLAKPPNHVWNYQDIFPRDTMPKPANRPLGWGDWIQFTNATVLRGHLVMRTAWEPSERLSRAARDSAIRDALGGSSRLMVQRVSGGFEKVVDLRDINAKVSQLRLADPAFKDRLVSIASLQMAAFPFRPPGADVRGLRGDFPFNNDSIWWRGVTAALSGSRASGGGSFQFNTGDLTVDLHADPVRFADLRWIYPRLPSDGHGKLDFHLKWRGAAQDYLAQNADVVVQGSHEVGSVGIMLTDTVAIHNTNLRFTGVDTRLLEQLIPHLQSPRRGVLDGQAEVNGGPHALHVDGSVAFHDALDGTSNIGALGEVGFFPAGLRATALRIQMRPFQMELLRHYDPTLPISGTVSGMMLVNGSTNSELAVVADIDHRDRGTRSQLNGKATVRLAGVKFIQADVTAHPVSLEEVGRFFPGVGLVGSAAGPIHVSGELSDLHFNTDLRLPDGGHLVAQAALNLASPVKTYDVVTALHTLNLRSILAKAPTTSLTARATAKGRGLTLATMNAAFAADMSTSRWDTIAVDTLTLRARVANGIADVPLFMARGSHAKAAANGSFGLVANRSGTLRWSVGTDSLGAFNRWLPRTAADTGAVAPRPAVMTRVFRRAREDSARIDRTTAIRRAATGAPAPRLVVHAPPAVRRDTVSGSLYASGQLSGNLTDFNITGAAGGDSIVARGNSARRLVAKFAWTNVRTPASTLYLGVDGDSVSASGFWFDTASVRLAYHAPDGHVEMLVRQSEKRDYTLTADFALQPSRKEVRVASMALQLDTAYWSAPHPMVIAWGSAGVDVSDFELRNRGAGRIYANGLLPTQGVSNFQLAIDNFPVQDVVDLLQSDVQFSGVIDVNGAMAGTLANPTFRGAFGIANGMYNGDTIPAAHGTFGYANDELVAHAEALRPPGVVVAATTNGRGPSATNVSNGEVVAPGGRMAVVDARLPIDLALTGVSGSRLLNAPLAIDVSGDSLPVNLISAFTPEISDVHGHVAGRITMRGTLQRPSIVGGLAIAKSSATITYLGTPINDMVGTVRMVNDTVFVDSIVGDNKGPVKLRGTIAIGTWRDPAFNLYLVGSGMQIMNNQWGNLRADVGLALTGPTSGAYLSGQVDVLDGVILAPEPVGRHVIGADDPNLFNVLDTAIVSEKNLFSQMSPLLTKIRVEATVNVHRDTWVRNRETNVEIYTEYPVYIRDEDENVSLVGAVTTDRGEYKFLSKRFQIQRGSAVFVGGPDLNPNLEVTGQYQVQVPTRGTLNIKVIVAGTLRQPRLSLTSDAQPPMSQSELMSYLAFGRSESELLQVSGSSIAGSPSGGDLFGVGAELAVRRLAGVALGVATDQVESSASKALGLDVLDITPADIPTELGQGSGLGTFFQQTQVVAGKYVNPRTFVSGQEVSGYPGLLLQHRTADGWELDASVLPRLFLLEPTLSSQSWRTYQSYGGFVIKDWRF